MNFDDHISGQDLPCLKCGEPRPAMWIEGPTGDGRNMLVLAGPCEECNRVNVYSIKDPAEKI